MRNFLFAAAHADRARKSFFGVAVLCPTGNSAVIKEQVARFAEDVLRPQFRDRIKLISYETYIAALRDVGDGEAAILGDFLERRLLEVC